MNTKPSSNDFNLLVSLGRETNITKILQITKEKLGASEIRFRIVDWKESAVVLPSVSESLTTAAEEKLEPELARRKFREACDCAVGKVAADFISEAENPQYLFRQLKSAKKGPFYEFKKEAAKRKEIARRQKEAWEAVRRVLEDMRNDTEFFKKALTALINGPFKIDEREAEGNERKRNWQQFWAYLWKEERLPGQSRIDRFLEEVDNTVEWYKDIFKKWKSYIKKYLDEYTSEIAIPVADGKKLLGVVNVHKKRGQFTATHREILKAISIVLTNAELHRRLNVLGSVQKVEQLMSGAWKFKEIAEKVAEGIKGGLAGLGGEDIYPLLYTPGRPITAYDDLKDLFEPKTWTFQPRANITGIEQKLGKIDIRSRGLGWKAVREWQKTEKEEAPEQPRARHYFIICGNVDNPNSKQGGSPSARAAGIKTTGCFPLVFERKVYGLLYLHCTKRHYFTDDELAALELFGSQTAVAIKNAEIMLGIKPYENLYGILLLELLGAIEFNGSNKFNEVGRRLKQWASEIRAVRGTEISTCIERYIDDISRVLGLPKQFLKDRKEEKQREMAFQPLEGYRDHFIHPFHVFCLGYYLLYCWNTHGFYPLNLGNSSNEYGDKEILRWFIAAIRHDIAYPVANFGRLVKYVFEKSVDKKMESRFRWEQAILAPGFSQAIDKLAALFQKKDPQRSADFKWWLMKRFIEDEDHGVLGALMLLSRFSSDAFAEAALAIALHSHRVESKRGTNVVLQKLDIQRFPLAFLLSLCDQAQEWGRNIPYDYLKSGISIDITQIYEKNWAKLESIEASGQSMKFELKNEISKNKKIQNNKSLEKVLSEVAEKFENTWSKEKDFEYNFVIDVKGNDGITIRAFGPRKPD